MEWRCGGGGFDEVNQKKNKTKQKTKQKKTNLEKKGKKPQKIEKLIKR